MGQLKKTYLFIGDEVELVEEGVVLGEVLVLPRGADREPPLLAEDRAVDRGVVALALLQALKLDSSFSDIVSFLSNTG